MAVVGVLVQAEVGDEGHLRPELVPQSAEGDLHDPVLCPRPAALGVLARGDAEEHERRHAQAGQPAGLLDQRLDGVLDDPR